MISIKKQKNLGVLIYVCYAYMAFGAANAVFYYITQDPAYYKWTMLWFVCSILLAVIYTIYKPVLLSIKQRRIKFLLSRLHAFNTKRRKLIYSECWPDKYFDIYLQYTKIMYLMRKILYAHFKKDLEKFYLEKKAHLLVNFSEEAIKVLKGS